MNERIVVYKEENLTSEDREVVYGAQIVFPNGMLSKRHTNPVLGDLVREVYADARPRHSSEPALPISNWETTSIFERKGIDYLVEPLDRGEFLTFHKDSRAILGRQGEE